MMKEKRLWDRILSIVLALALAGFIGALGYVTAKPRVVEKFTEFYILGLEGKAIGYTQTLVLGEAGKIILGIANREQRTVEYGVDITINGEKATAVGPITLQKDEKWEQPVSFLPSKAGLRQRVEFLLIKAPQAKPYASLVLWINVKEPFK